MPSPFDASLALVAPSAYISSTSSAIGVGDGEGRGARALSRPNFGKKYFSSKCHDEKFAYFQGRISLKIRTFSGKHCVKFWIFLFSSKYRVKLGRFVNVSYIHFRAKMSCHPPKLTQLLRLCCRGRPRRRRRRRFAGGTDGAADGERSSTCGERSPTCVRRCTGNSEPAAPAARDPLVDCISPNSTMSTSP